MPAASSIRSRNCSTQPHQPWDKGDPSQWNPDSLTLPGNIPDTEGVREAYTRYLAEIEYLDGASMLPVWLGGADTVRRYTYSEQTIRGICVGSEYYPIRAVSDGRYRYIRNLTLQAEFRNLVTAGNRGWARDMFDSADPHNRWLLNRYRHRPYEELYDARYDPENSVNLAGNGMVFEHAFVASPACAPSRGALLNGLMPVRNGADRNHSRPR